MLEKRLGVGTLATAVVAVAAGLSSCGGGDDETTGASGGASAAGAPTVVKSAGDIRSTVKSFQSLLGPDNGGAPDGDPDGRREINWDKVPDNLAAPNALPADAFNAKQDPGARGAVLETPGDHVAVSADSENAANTPVRFGDVNPSYSDEFTTFSAERLFSPIGSNVVNLSFFVPGTDTPAVTRGFGAVYTDIDAAENTAFEYFNADGKSLGKFAAPVSKDGLSFLGVAFEKPVVAKVRIAYGNGKLGPDESADYDVAVMDDFIYGEPQAG
jgi:hypothetical protein